MGNLLGSPVTEKETHVGGTPDGVIQYGVSSMQGWRVHMEDAHIAEPELYASVPDGTKIDLPGHSLFAVFDGHGGTFAAEYAGAHFCRVLSKEAKFVQYANFVQTKEDDAKTATEKAAHVRAGLELLEGALRDAFVTMDCEILQAVQGHSNIVPVPYNGGSPDCKPLTPKDDEDAGTTAVVVMVTPLWIVCANAGDSRAVTSKQGHRAVPLSYDHKPDDEEEERRIRAAGGYVAGGRVEGDLAVSRGLGDFRFKLASTVLAGNDNAAMDDDAAMQPEQNVKPEDQKVSSVPDIIVQNRSEEQDEFIIVACDGIWDVQTNYECVKMAADMFAEGERDIGLVCEEVSCFFVDYSVLCVVASPQWLLVIYLLQAIDLLLTHSQMYLLYLQLHLIISDARHVLEHGQ